jgi:hypothetical protein
VSARASTPVDAPKSGGKKGGLILRARGELLFVPAHVATSVAPPPRIARVIGAPPELLGIAVHEGEIVPVVSVGEARTVMVVCAHLGELLGVVGGEVLDAGMFDEAPDGVRYGNEAARLLELGALYARVQSSAWAGRWAV